jgi:hypothetical protein
MNPHVEASLRAVAIFMSVFGAYRWTSNSLPEYDVALMFAAIALAVAANHYGPLKM